MGVREALTTRRKTTWDHYQMTISMTALDCSVTRSVGALGFHSRRPHDELDAAAQAMISMISMMMMMMMMTMMMTMV